MLKKIYNYFNNQSTIFKILLALFALVLTKAIFIFPLTFISGALGIVLGILLFIIVFLTCVISLYFLNKVSWNYKKTKVKKSRILIYMIPPILLNALLLFTYFPGKMSWDSMYIWSTILQGDYSNLHPITYSLFVRLLHSIVDSPWLVITVQFIYASFVYAYASYVFEGMGLNKKLCWAIVIILTIYPVNFHQSITMLKDVPYMISLILISIIIMKILVENSLSFGRISALFIASLVAMFSRHNGAISVPIVLTIFIIYFLLRKNKISALKITALLAAILISFFSTNKTIEYVMRNDYSKRSNIGGMMMMPSAQCSYTIYKNYDNMSGDLQVEIDRFYNVEGIFSQSVTYPSWEFNNRPLISLNTDTVKYNQIEFLRLYLKMLKAYPKDMMLGYQQITGIIWAIPNYGYTVYHNIGIANYNDSFSFEIAYEPQLPKLAEYLDTTMSVVFWLRPAIWLMLSILLLFSSSKRHGTMGICIISPAIANALPFFLGTPAQNSRYFYCNFSIFIIIIIFSFMTKSKVLNPTVEKNN